MKTALIALWCLLASVAVLAQVQHNHPAVAIIDGAKNPELIPDIVTYRLYLLTVAHMTPTLQEAQLKSAGLSPSEIPAAAKVLDDFKTQFDALRKAHNDAVVAAKASRPRPDSRLFAMQRDALVNSAVGALGGALTANGMQAFRSHVTAEKKRMKLSGATTLP